MTDRLVGDAKKMVEVVDDLLSWILESRPDLEDGPVITYTRKHLDRLRDSANTQFDLDKAIEESAARGLTFDPETNQGAVDVAKIRAGTNKHRLAEVFYQHPEGLTATEAVLVAGLKVSRDVLRSAESLELMGALRGTGRDRSDERVFTMTIAAREAWRAKYGDLAPIEVLSMFGDVEVVDG